jgi:hypothetical protein
MDETYLKNTNMYNIGINAWNSYHQAVSAALPDDASVLELPMREFHEALAPQSAARSDNLTKRMFLANPGLKPVAGAKYKSSAADARLDVKIAYRLCSVSPPDFARHLHETVNGIKHMLQAGHVTTPVPNCLGRQAAHDLIYALAVAAACPIRPFPPMESLLVFHLYRFFCDENDNIFAAAISSRVEELRAILLDPIQNIKVLQHLEKRAVFHPSSKETTWTPPAASQRTLSGLARVSIEYEKDS